MNTSTTIYNERVLDFPVETVFAAFSQPELLQLWWGPKGFTNTIHIFDFFPGGHWKLTMHGPDKGNYENESIFEFIEPNKRVTWKRLTQPYFAMEVRFDKISVTTTKISFLMKFEDEASCSKIKAFAQPKNEENFDRLEKLLHASI